MDPPRRFCPPRPGPGPGPRPAVPVARGLRGVAAFSPRLPSPGPAQPRLPSSPFPALFRRLGLDERPPLERPLGRWAVVRGWRGLAQPRSPAHGAPLVPQVGAVVAMGRRRFRPGRCSSSSRRRRRGQRWRRSPRVGSESPKPLNRQCPPSSGSSSIFSVLSTPFYILSPFLLPFHPLCLPLPHKSNLFSLSFPSPLSLLPFIPKIGCFEPPGCCGAGEGGISGGHGQLWGSAATPRVCQAHPSPPWGHRILWKGRGDALPTQPGRAAAAAAAAPTTPSPPSPQPCPSPVPTPETPPAAARP